ncbi:hypothetical protein R8Z50_22290 [Longispora sp. K20-0274]|uniref:hypothetical protein n=1 Tax=Longispora sp. K20-0274 TaxID=3088255 RepID=UPI00399A9363
MSLRDALLAGGPFTDDDRKEAQALDAGDYFDLLSGLPNGNYPDNKDPSVFNNVSEGVVAQRLCRATVGDRAYNGRLVYFFKVDADTWADEVDPAYLLADLD